MPKVPGYHFQQKHNKEHSQRKDSSIFSFLFELLNDYAVAKTRVLFIRRLHFYTKDRYEYCTILIAKILMISLSDNR